MARSSKNILRIAARLRSQGLGWAFAALRERTFPQGPSFTAEAMERLRDGRLLELGGPSRIFSGRGALPAYSAAARVDNVNFRAETAWEGGLSDGGAFHFRSGVTPGTQYLREAGRLEGIPDATYDGILSSHCLEHLANPLGALLEWRRVAKPGATLLLILPDPPRTFDHRRPLTAMEHLRADLEANTGEEDDTHFAEVLALHDLARDPAAGSEGEFRARVLRNAAERCVHHHVFDAALLSGCLVSTGWIPVAAASFGSVHLGALARKAES